MRRNLPGNSGTGILALITVTTPPSVKQYAYFGSVVTSECECECARACRQVVRDAALRALQRLEDVLAELLCGLHALPLARRLLLAKYDVSKDNA